MSTLALQSHVFDFSTSYLKWASLDLSSGSWLAAYIDSVPNGLYARLPTLPSLSSNVTFLSSQSRPQVMNALSSQSHTVSSRPYQTIPVPREETLTLWGKFRKVGWHRPNHKPSTTKIVAWAKNLWDRYVTLDDLSHLSCIRARVTDDIFSGIVSTSVSTPINTYKRADLPISKPGLTGSTAKTKKKMHETISQLWKMVVPILPSWLCSNIKWQKAESRRIHPQNLFDTAAHLKMSSRQATLCSTTWQLRD